VAEVIRFRSSFADALKMLVAEAIRSVHPPIAYDADADPTRRAQSMEGRHTFSFDPRRPKLHRDSSVRSRLPERLRVQRS
jgi:hypothetical protein